MSTRFEPELRELSVAGVIDEATAARAIALDRGATLSLFVELRIALYLAVALITTGLGIFIKNNLDRIGPITLIAILALVAAVCYASAIRTRLSGADRSLGGDYVLLLGALILSADLGYAESQFHWLGADWSRHLLILAVLHGLAAYLLDSRLVLSVALTSLAGWFGIEHQGIDLGDMHAHWPELAGRAFVCASVILGWRVTHHYFQAPQRFANVFEHFAANLAFWGALVWCSNDGTRALGALAVTTLAIIAVVKGLRSRQEMFLVYGVGYLALCYAVLAMHFLDELPGTIAVLTIVIGAAVLLWGLHGRLKESAR